MKEKEVVEVMWFILNKLNMMDKWAGSHTEITKIQKDFWDAENRKLFSSIKNLFKGLPIKYTASAQGKKIIQKAIKKLINNRFINAKPSTGEIHVSLNAHKAAEIKEFIRRFR